MLLSHTKYQVNPKLIACEKKVPSWKKEACNGNF
jgi:hypothetical protein